MRRSILAIAVGLVSSAAMAVSVQSHFMTLPTGVGNSLDVKISVTDSPTVSGYNFRIGYDATKFTLNSAVDISGMAGGFQIDPLINTSLGNGDSVGLPTTGYRPLIQTYNADVIGASDLLQLNFTQNQVGGFDIKLADNDAQGLVDDTFSTIPHDFFNATLPVSVSAFEIE